MQRRFDQVDVFTSRPLRGNALAVVHEAQGLSDMQMAELARWTNLSETAFLLPPTDPQADYRVRIFTPGGELPFAGHPTLGSAFAWLAAGGQARHEAELVQQCQVGLVKLRREGGRLAFAAPPTTVKPIEPELLGSLQAALGLQSHQVLNAAWLSNGFPQAAFEVDSAGTVTSLKPDHAALRRLGVKAGVVGRHPAGSECDVEVRFFVSPLGIEEDPVTGSFNANLGRWLMSDGRMPRRYTAAQGTCVGREGRIHLHDDGRTLWVGGDVVPLICGTIAL